MMMIKLLKFHCLNCEQTLINLEKHFNEDSIRELADSIKEHGVIQPIIVRNVLKGFEIIAGERRFRASQVSGIRNDSCC